MAPIRKTPQPLLRDNGLNPQKKSQVTLRWRPSGQTDSAAPASNPAALPITAASAAPLRPLQPVLGQVRLAPIAQVNYDQDPSDPFLDPFADGNAFIQASPQSPDSAIQAPSIGVDEPPRSGFSVPGFEPVPSNSPDPSELPVPHSGGESNNSPFKDLPPTTDLAPKTDSPLSLQGPAAPQTPRSPFGKDLPAEDSDGDDVDSPSDRSSSGRVGANESSRIGESSEEQAKDKLRTDCVDLERRVTARNIRQVSLDISPPFQLHLKENVGDNYSARKQRFIDSQPVRTWLSKSGEELAEGSLLDIAFEKVIIVTETGEELELALPQLSNEDLAYVTDAWELPSECQLPNIAFKGRHWLPMQMTWRAPDLCHKPLYFEEVNLERYGHTAGPFAQPLVSSAHFFFNIAALPYKMGIHPPNECQYALGYYRPGNCAPWIIPPVPLSLRGAMLETAVIGAGIGLIP